MDLYHRQRDLLLPENLHHLDVDIVGAGSLGGAILLCLGKMGFGVLNRLTVTDFDICETHNLPTQWFRSTDVAMNRSKVEALADMSAWVLDCDIEISRARFTGAEERRLGPIVILAVDSLEERRAIWSRLKQREDVRFLVDARAGGEVVEVHALDLGNDSHEEYERSLQGEPFEEPCTRRSIVYTVLAAAALVGSTVRSWVRGDDYARSVVFDVRNFWVERPEPGAAAAAGGTADAGEAAAAPSVAETAAAND